MNFLLVPLVAAILVIVAAAAVSKTPRLMGAAHEVTKVGVAEKNMRASLRLIATTASDVDNDGTLEVRPPRPAWWFWWFWPFELPTAPEVDPWGSPYVRCSYDHPGLPAPDAVLAAMVSLGPDKIQDTTCEQAATGRNGDDLVERVMLNEARDPDMAAGGRRSAAKAAPVPTLAALNLLLPAALMVGEERLVLENHQTYVWDGSAWYSTRETVYPDQWEQTSIIDAPVYTPSLPATMAWGGMNSLAAMDVHRTTLFAGTTTRAAGLNQGQFGAGYAFNANYTALQQVNVGNTVGVTTLAGGATLVDSLGNLWTAGINIDGRLGTGNTNNTTAYQQVATGVAQAAIFVDHTVRIDTDGTVWAVGDGASWKRRYPAGVNWPAILTWEKIYDPQGQSRSMPVALALGNQHTVLLTADGTVFAGGFAGFCGVVGGGSRYPGGDVLNFHHNLRAVFGNAVAIAAAGLATYALRSDGVLFATGCNTNHSLLDAVALGAHTNGQFIQIAAGVSKIAAGWGTIVYIDTSQRLWAAGGNSYCSIRNPASLRTPVVQVASSVVNAWATDEALMWQDTQGRVWGRGRDEGRFGQGNIATRCTPVQVLANLP